ncbi:MAG TPA: serine hydrolase [Chthonomonadaceae bacterium]|nr:serine hydrolase [Chthonomonadaceae bacterium]
MAGSPGAEERIARVIAGLQPGTYLRGMAAPTYPLAERLAYYETPGISIAVIEDYEIAWTRGYGVKEAGKSDAVTTETLFQAGSISKPVAAMAALHLVEAGKLDLDEDVNTYLTSWKVPPNADWQPRITLRQLLSHTAGLTIHGFPGYLPTRPIPTVPQLLDGEPPANTGAVRVNAVPGTQFRYSGGGTTIVQLMLMDVLGKPFPQIMRKLVLDPLQMHHSTYEQPLPPSRAEFAATGHPSDSRPVEGKWHIYPEMAAAGLWTTASDLARWAIEVQLSRQGRSNKVLSAEMVQQMLSPQVEDHIGIGPFLEGKEETARFGHGGWDEGFICHLIAYQQRGQGSVVMINSNRGGEVITEVERAIAREYAWPDFLPQEPTLAAVTSDSLAAYVGVYELRPNFQFTVTRSEEGLLLQPTGQPPLSLFAESETKFFARAVGAEISFVKKDSGEVEELVFLQNGRPQTARKQIPNS